MKQMKRDAGILALWLIIGQVFFYGITFAVVLVFTFAGHGGLGQYVGADLGSLFANGILMGGYWLVKRKKIVQAENRASQDTGASAFPVVGGALVCLLLWNAMISSVDVATGHFLGVPMGQQTMNALPMLLLVAVFPALVEEFAFRKVIFGVMRPHGFFVATMFSSAMFGLMHQNFIQLVFAFGMGMILCLVYEQTGRIVYCMILHFANNAVSVLLPYIRGYEQYGVYVEVAVGVLGFVAVAISVLRRGEKWRNELLWREVDWKALKCCLSSVAVILYTVLCMGMAVFTVWLAIQSKL